LGDLADDVGLSLDAGALGRFAAYRDLLLRWNDRFNLTAIAEPDEVDRRLILDALLMLPAIDAATAGIATPRRIDVGSGAGFPGLALKIARPNLVVTLVEATGKKVWFLRACVEELGLERVEARHARAEDLGHDPAYRGRFDLATARAVATLPALLELCMPFLRSGGRAFFPKGLNIAAELEAGRRAAPLVGARLAGAELLPGGRTTLVVAEKVAPTPARLPRRPGLPSREPLGVPPSRQGVARRAPVGSSPAPPDRGARIGQRGGRLAS
jgi:16S rRNA (guanine527-N7)-methyltransferase